MTRRVRARVEGVVQGVGYRPFVYRLATELELRGWVLNDSRGVLVEAEGQTVVIDGFLERLASDAPPLAVVERVLPEDVDTEGGAGFRILESGAGEPDALVSADAATCDDCLAELFDPADRRHRYPFTNCTNCGPRFTIVTGVPYDRPATTMAGFTMCAACQAEYDDPADRRFHAQPNACADCGPALSLPLEQVVDALNDGLVVAVKGLGGYHLAALAHHQMAVAKLRERKHREDKPFALMAADVQAARALVDLTPDEEVLLGGRERPIVIARRRADAAVAAAVAPGSPDLGVMLPYTPLHHLLLADVGAPLVMTSANVSDEPIAYTDTDARDRLAGIADLTLAHDRPIHMRTDDSVVRAVARGAPLTLRRSRGYVPASLWLPVAAGVPVTAYGAELKSTICVAKGARAWPSHHIGDLGNWETLRSFREAVQHFERLFAVEPRVVAHDMHPEYLSTKEALARTDGVRHQAVQHHHAHLAACLAEHGRTDLAVGAVFDGTGYGTDGTVWGGELLVGDLEGFDRAAHLLPVPMPGSERAIHEPWRMALSWLAELGLPTDEPPPALRGMVDPTRWRQVAAVRAAGTASPQTSSVGRLFDAVSALCGVRAEVRYEGQAAIELESLAYAGGAADPYPFPLEAGVLDARQTMEAVVGDLAAGARPPTVAARLHAGVAAGTAAACARLAGERGLDTVVLTGGVFANRLLLDATSAHLAGLGLEVLRPERLPPGDGGIAYGQAAVAAALTT